MGWNGRRAVAAVGVVGLLVLLVGLVGFWLLRELMMLRGAGAYPGATILLVVRNCEECIEGLLRHLLGSWAFGELLVVDAGSCDDTPEIAGRLLRSRPGTRVILAGEIAGLPPDEWVKPERGNPVYRARLFEVGDYHQALNILRDYLPEQMV